MVGSDIMDECGSFFEQMEDLIEFPTVNECGLDLGSIEQMEDLIEFPTPTLNECGLDTGNNNDFPSIWSNPLENFPGSGPIFSANNISNMSDLSAEVFLGSGPIFFDNNNSSVSNLSTDVFPGSGPIFSRNNIDSASNISMEVFQSSNLVFSDNNSSGASELSAELSVPREDILQLEWMPNFVEESFSGGGMTVNIENSLGNDDSQKKFQTSSPVSVLESSSSSSNSSCSEGKILLISPIQHGPQRARSKRPRPPTFIPRSAATHGMENPLLVSVPVTSLESGNFAESHPIKKKKKKVKLSIPLGPVDINQNMPSQGVRKCVHCEITKTPQWRAGPMGPKTLCNACGVRHKSGRLFPEYRPAASPTFVPSVHSNSHKKVLEMRSKGEIPDVRSVGPLEFSQEST